MFSIQFGKKKGCKSTKKLNIVKFIKQLLRSINRDYAFDSSLVRLKIISFLTKHSPESERFSQFESRLLV